MLFNLRNAFPAVEERDAAKESTSFGKQGAAVVDYGEEEDIYHFSLTCVYYLCVRGCKCTGAIED